jgi:hypothetical protein
VIDAVLDFLAHPADLEPIALDLFRWQVAHNPAYRRIAAGAEPRRLDEIPAVPVALFRDVDLRAFEGQAGATFRTSGTTSAGAHRGAHPMRDTVVYERAARTWFETVVPDAPGRVVSLVSHEPDSSLGHMVAAFATELLPFFRDGAVDPAVWGALRDPCFLAATAFALDGLLAGAGTAHLGPGSLVMVTGGFKGRAVRLDADALYAALPRFGQPRVVGEYGMTELSSQLWTRPVPAGSLPGPFLAPPWLHVYTVDPLSGLPCAGVGLLRFVDLANVWSVLAIETMDLGEVHGNALTLHGRLEGAELRGCSLRAEDFLAAVRG